MLFLIFFFFGEKYTCILNEFRGYRDKCELCVFFKFYIVGSGYLKGIFFFLLEDIETYCVIKSW